MRNLTKIIVGTFTMVILVACNPAVFMNQVASPPGGTVDASLYLGSWNEDTLGTEISVSTASGPQLELEITDSTGGLPQVTETIAVSLTEVSGRIRNLGEPQVPRDVG